MNGEWGSSLPLTVVVFRDYEQRSTADLTRTDVHVHRESTFWSVLLCVDIRFAVYHIIMGDILLEKWTNYPEKIVKSFILLYGYTDMVNH